MTRHGRFVTAGIGTVAALLLLWLSVGANIKRSCIVMDAPYLPVCQGTEQSGSPARLATLKRNIAANPGGLDFLHRDVCNVAAWFGRRGIDDDPEEVFADLLSVAFG